MLKIPFTSKPILICLFFFIGVGNNSCNKSSVAKDAGSSIDLTSERDRDGRSQDLVLPRDMTLAPDGIPSTSLAECIAPSVSESPNPEPLHPCGSMTLAAGIYYFRENGTPLAESIFSGTNPPDYSYSLYIPSTYNAATPKPLPLVLGFHGGTGNAAQFNSNSDLQTMAEFAGFILLTPNGSACVPGQPLHIKCWNAGNCCGQYADRIVKKQGLVCVDANGNPIPAGQPCITIDNSANSHDDVNTHISPLIDQVGSRVCIDLHRIFATGHSNGAMFSYRLACQLSQFIAAVAPTGGGMGSIDQNVTPPLDVFACNPTKKVPILHVHGDKDLCYPYQGGASKGGLSQIIYLSIPETLDVWKTINVCNPTPTALPMLGGGATCIKYQGCGGGADIRVIRIAEAGHVWPGSDTYVGADKCGGSTAKILNNNNVIWSFFEAHPRL